MPVNDDIDARLETIEEIEVDRFVDEAKAEDIKAKRQRLINVGKDFFEQRKDYMRDNRHIRGEVTFYPTSKAVMRGLK